MIAIQPRSPGSGTPHCCQTRPVHGCKARTAEDKAPADETSASPAELKAFLAPQFAKFWLPDDFAFVDAIPRTSAGKFKKSALRDQFKDYQAAE